MEYFINSDLSVAVRLSELFGLDTVSQRKEHLLSYIHELEREYQDKKDIDTAEHIIFL